MRRVDLQLFGAVSGKKMLYLYRPHSDAATMDGTQIAFVTENGRTKSKDADSTATKDGSIRTPGAMEQEITCTSILSENDTFVDTLEECLDDDKLMDIWEADLARPCYTDTYTLTSDAAPVSGKTYYTRTGSGTSESPYVYTPVATPSSSSMDSYYEKESTANGKFKGRYFQGYVTEFEKTSNAEDMVEISLTFGINGKGVKGDVTVTAEQQEAASYVFVDTPKTGA